MMSISTQPMASSPATAGVPEAPPGLSGDPPASFAAVIAPFTAPPARQSGTATGKALPVAPPLDPQPDDWAIETAGADSVDKTSEDDGGDRVALAEDTDIRAQEPILAWFAAPTADARPDEIATYSREGGSPGLPAAPLAALDSRLRGNTVETTEADSRSVELDPVRTGLVEALPVPSGEREGRGVDKLGANGLEKPFTGQPGLDPAASVSPRRTVASAQQMTAVPALLAGIVDSAPILRPRRADSAAMSDTTLAATATILPHAVAPVATPDQAPLDMTRHGWPQAMIDRIEALRDDADAVDTRIRIVPDALGTIDVSLRRQGEVTHVHFAADQAQTRHILADAQPRLAELAESRGLKLAQGSVDSGTGQQQQRHQPPSFAPRAPVRAHRAGSATDHRIA